jgi:hypothetical protein
MKKLISVLLCIVLMFTFLTVMSSAADADGSETIANILYQLGQNANWGQIFGILLQTLQTFLRIIGALGA